LSSTEEEERYTPAAIAAAAEIASIASAQPFVPLHAPGRPSTSEISAAGGDDDEHDRDIRAAS